MTTRKQVIDEARSWIGTRYQHQAGVKGLAVDCINLIVGVANAVGIVPPDFSMDRYSGYGRSPDPKTLIGGCEQFLTRIDKADAIPGDILVLRFEREPQHFAILSDDNPPRMIHAYASARKATEQIIDADWASKIVAVYRFKGLED